MPQMQQPAERSISVAEEDTPHTPGILPKAQDDNAQGFQSNSEPAPLGGDDHPLGHQPFTASIKRSSDVHLEHSKRCKLGPTTED